VGGGVQLGSLGTAATNRPIVPAPGDYDDEEIGGMIGRGNRNTRRKPAPVPLCLPQTPHAARTRNQAAAVGSQRLTAWAAARSFVYFSLYIFIYQTRRHQIQILQKEGEAVKFQWYVIFTDIIFRNYKEVTYKDIQELAKKDIWRFLFFNSLPLRKQLTSVRTAKL
jgi:hypothetical protein